MLKTHSGIIGFRSDVARKLSAKSLDLYDLVEKYLAIWKTESSSLRNPLRFLAQPLCAISTKNQGIKSCGQTEKTTIKF